MPSLTTWFVRKLVETAPKLAFQVTASVAATLCAAFLSNALLSTGPRQPAARAGDVVIADFGAHLLKASFAEGGFRVRSSYPTEFGEVFGPAPDKLATGVTWSEPARVPDATLTSEAHADKKPAASTRPCAGECGRKVVAAVLPPPRPVVTEVAQASPATSPSPAEPKRLRLLGVPLPGFVPSGEAIVSTVVSLGDTVTGIIPRL